MRRIVVGEDRPGHEKDAGSTPAGGQVTLVFPETGSEYEQARADVETLAQTPGRTARRRRRKAVAQARDPIATTEKPVDGCYVVTTDKQRRAWGLPDLAAAAGGEADRAEPGATQGRDAVAVVDPSDAVPFLLGNAPQRPDRRRDRADAGGTRARPGRARQGRPDAPTVNLKQNRGPLPADLRTAFGGWRAWCAKTSRVPDGWSRKPSRRGSARRRSARNDAGDRTRRPGVALGLAATVASGEVAVVEARCA